MSKRLERLERSASSGTASPRRTYPEEFKREAVRLLEERGNLRATARELGVDVMSLANWRDRIRDEAAGKTKPAANEGGVGPVAFPGSGNPSDPELARLRRENARLREENEILKKAVGIFTQRPA